MRKLFLITIFASFFLTGCEKNPLEKLAGDKVYVDMNNVFWAKEHKANSALWKEGLAYCEKNLKKPNCAPLMMIYMINNGETKAPKIGHSGNEIKIPNF